MVATVSRLLRTTDLPQVYTGVSGTNFALAPGEAYQIVVTNSVTFTPAHY